MISGVLLYVVMNCNFPAFAKVSVSVLDSYLSNLSFVILVIVIRSEMDIHKVQDKEITTVFNKKH